MIAVAAAVIAHRRADILRHRVEIAEQFLERLVRDLRMLVERLVQLSDIRLVMLRVMDLHRLRIDVWLERIIAIWKFGKFVFHIFLMYYIYLFLATLYAL